MENKLLNVIFKRIGIGLLFFFLNSCTYSQKSETFDVFKSGFPIIEGLMKIDSLVLREMLKSNDNKLIPKEDHRYIGLSSFNEDCNDQSKYVLKKIGKIALKEKVCLLYLIELNKDCPTDANELYYVICLYDLKGTLIKDMVIGQLYEVFGRSEYKYFTLSVDQFKVRINITTYEEIMNDNNPDITHKEELIDTVVLQ